MTISTLLVPLFKHSPKKPSFLSLLSRSQHQSRRNAMVACTELAQRRAEREDVAEFLAGVAVRAEPEEPLMRASP